MTNGGRARQITPLRWYRLTDEPCAIEHSSIISLTSEGKDDQDQEGRL